MTNVRILAIDPGVHRHAWALIGKGLLDCGIGERFPRDINRVVIEMPRIYPKARSKVPPNDIVDLAYAAGVAVGGIIAGDPNVKVQVVTPREWKGTIPKTKKWDRYIIHKRIAQWLTPPERIVYVKALEQVAPSLRHNIVDAVGIGLWAYGFRFNKKATTQGREP